MIKILIVDDDITRKDKIINLLKQQEWKNFIEITWCDTSNKTRESCKIHQYDILILDVLLPKKDDDTANALEGLKLLKDLSTKQKYLTPKKIIGITADIQSIEQYKQTFNMYTSVVYEAKKHQNKWLELILQYISNIISSQLTVKSRKKDTIVISLHGIRTFGEWQNDFSDTINNHLHNVKHHAFKYGFFGFILFLFPIFRYLKAAHLSKLIYQVIQENPDKKIYIFAHSYGTYVIAHLLESYEFKNKIHMLFFAGSVLPDSYNVKNKLGPKVKRIVNDCATNDLVLIINKLFVTFLGDAGRVGFIGDNYSEFANRYFKGGHSVYFEKENGKNFIEENWIPYILDDKELKIIDERTKSSIISDIGEPILSMMSRIMPFVYIFLIYYFFFNNEQL